MILRGSATGNSPETLWGSAEAQAVQFFGIPKERLTIKLEDVQTYYNYQTTERASIRFYEADFTARVA